MLEVELELKFSAKLGKTTVSDRHQIRLGFVVGLGWRSDLVVFPQIETCVVGWSRGGDGVRTIFSLPNRAGRDPK